MGFNGRKRGAGGGAPNLEGAGVLKNAPGKGLWGVCMTGKDISSLAGLSSYPSMLTAIPDAALDDSIKKTSCGAIIACIARSSVVRWPDSSRSRMRLSCKHLRVRDAPRRVESEKFPNCSIT